MDYSVKIKKNNELDCEIAYFKEANFTLDSGYKFDEFKIAYKTFGNLNKNRSNVILVCHALTGDQFVKGKNPVTNKDGWWEKMVGSNKPLNTDEYFIICSNVLGGCLGSTGPKEINPKTKKPYGMDFPSVTIRDIVKAQSYLIDSLNINKIFAIVGASMGAMQVIQWTIDFHKPILFDK